LQGGYFLSAKGTNDEEVPEELVKLLKFVGAQPSESEKDFEDAFVKRLQNSIQEVKASRKMGARHMIFQEMLQEGRVEERGQMLIEILEEKGEVSEELQKMIQEEANLDVLKQWSKMALKAETLEQFEKGIVARRT